MGKLTWGCASLHPGLCHFAPSGLKIQLDYSCVYVPVVFAEEERLIHIYKPEAQATDFYTLVVEVSDGRRFKVNKEAPELSAMGLL